MPELPEAERARLTLQSQLGKRIAAIDDSDTYVCRPHQPGEIAWALVGHTFGRSSGALSDDELDRLRRALRAAVRSAIRSGGVHTGTFVQARGRDGSCPRDGHPLERAAIGGRTTYWCPACQEEAADELARARR